MSGHHGSSVRAPQSRAVLGLLILNFKRGATSLEIQRRGVMDPRGAVYELRRAGYRIDTVYERMTRKRRSVFRYFYRGRKGAANV